MSAPTGQAPALDTQCADQTAFHHLAPRRWTDAQRRAASHVAATLAGRIPPADFMLVGLAGPPGSGKSTLAHLVCTILGVDGREATVLSLDDYYLDSTQRASLAKDHPLLQQRGVPGTHDWGALIADVDKLRAGDLATLRLPRFDKSRDEPVATSQFRTLKEQPAVVIFEGWLVGAPAQHASELTEPVNVMEAEADPDGRWRKWVNDHLASYHQALARRLDERWYLSAPDWETVVGWRWQQEQETASQAGQHHLASRGDVASFLNQFQRIAQHMQHSARDWADVVVRIDENHIMELS